MKTEIPAGRDLSLDLVRVACVLLVVFVHLVLIGVGKNPDGSLLFASPVNESKWVGPASWIVEIMPLFFVVGGYAARVGWVSAQRRGESAEDFVRARLARLARPALPLYCFLALCLVGLPVFRVDPALVQMVAVPVGSVLWFLGAYMLVQALAPWMIRWHEKSPWIALSTLLVAALVVDIIRLVVGIWWLGLGKIDSAGSGLGDELFGIPNVAFVWLFAQQLGFCLKDGWFSRLSALQLVAIIVASFSVVALLVGVGSYDTSMLSNQWPPTTPLAVLAIVQASAYTLFHAPLAAVMRLKWMQALVFYFGSRLMSIYLWHVTAIVAITGLLLILPWPMPIPGGEVWWWTRPVMMVAVFALVGVISLWTVRFERPNPQFLQRRVTRAATIAGVVLFILPSLAISLYGLDLPLALLAVTCTVLSLGLASGRVGSHIAESAVLVSR